MKKKRRINDIVLITVLVLIPLLMFAFGRTGDEIAGSAALLITVDGIPYDTLPLSDEKELTITTEDGFNKVVVMGGEAWVSDADCPDKVCVYHSRISKSGEQIVCLPHKVVLEIIRGEEGDIDSISH
jgi:hypothetical protein